MNATLNQIETFRQTELPESITMSSPKTTDVLRGNSPEAVGIQRGTNSAALEAFEGSLQSDLDAVNNGASHAEAVEENSGIRQLFGLRAKVGRRINGILDKFAFVRAENKELAALNQLENRTDIQEYERKVRQSLADLRPSFTLAWLVTLPAFMVPFKAVVLGLGYMGIHLGAHAKLKLKKGEDYIAKRISSIKGVVVNVADKIGNKVKGLNQKMDSVLGYLDDNIANLKSWLRG